MTALLSLILGQTGPFPSTNGLPVVAPLNQAETRALRSLDRMLAANLLYDGGYTTSGVPRRGTGVCTDVVLVMLRDLGFDLRASMTADIRANARAYRIAKPDPAIDHRRARNQIMFMGRSPRFAKVRGAWRPGDIVFWTTRRNGFVDHVGVVGRYRFPSGETSIVHHWPGLPVVESGGATAWPVVGVFRLIGP